MYIHTCIHTYIHACINKYIHGKGSECAFECVNACRECGHYHEAVSMCMWICLHTHIHTVSVHCVPSKVCMSRSFPFKNGLILCIYIYIYIYICVCVKILIQRNINCL